MVIPLTNNNQLKTNPCVKDSIISQLTNIYNSKNKATVHVFDGDILMPTGTSLIQTILYLSRCTGVCIRIRVCPVARLMKEFNYKVLISCSGCKIFNNLYDKCMISFSHLWMLLKGKT